MPRRPPLSILPGGLKTFVGCGCPRPPPSRLQRAADRSVQRGFRPRSWDQGGNVFEQLSAALVPEGTIQAEWDNLVATNSGAKRAEAHQWLERCGITAEVADQGTEKGEIMGEWIVVTQAGDPGFQRFLSGLLNLVPLGGLFESITIEHGSGRLEIALGDPEPPDANTGADAHSSAAPPPGRAAPIGGSLDRRSGTSPQGVQLWQSAQFGVRGDQPRAQLQGRGPDQAIRWIAMLKYGAARQQGNLWSDWLPSAGAGLPAVGSGKNRR